jgi:uncharacterized membrane protein YhaH (DUF805 family)
VQPCGDHVVTWLPCCRILVHQGKQLNNPYNAPISTFQEIEADDDLTTYQPRFFAWNGRLNRLRYVAYSTAALCAGMIIGMAIAMIIAFAFFATKGPELHDSQFETLIEIVIAIPVYIATTIFARRRLHDLELSGWYALIGLIPYVSGIFGLVLTFKKGTEGRNSFGPEPVPNTVGVWIAALGIPAAVIIGIVVLATSGTALQDFL